MYSPLNTSRREIRLLRLMAGSVSDKIQCELFVISLDDPIKFEALSYAWGDAHDTLSITLEGQLRSATRNLESALRNLRYSFQDRKLWVDALCINQNDISERSNQVGLMRDIYSTAKEVVVWLGASRLGEDRDPVVEAIEKRGRNPIEIHWTKQEYLDLFVFFLHPWWTRIWTVQEAILARRLVYQQGRFTMSEDHIRRLAESYTYHTSVRRCCNTRAATHKTGNSAFEDLHFLLIRIQYLHGLRAQEQHNERRFEHVIASFWSRDATDARDRVYGLFGISIGVNTSAVDYSLTAAQVFENTARDVAASSRNLDFLSQIQEPTDLDLTKEAHENEPSIVETPDIPSWVPDWGASNPTDAKEIEAELIWYRMSFLSLYHACGELEFTPQPDDMPGTFTVSGLICDTIKQVSSKPMKCGFRYDIRPLTEWRDMVGIETNPGRLYPDSRGNVTISDAFWRTLCMDITPFSDASTSDPASNHTEIHAGSNVQFKRAEMMDHLSHHAWWCLELLRLHELVRSNPIALNPRLAFYFEKGTNFGEHSRKVTQKRRFFVSEKGYIGLAPKDAQVGDQICVLAGGKMPFVLREVKEASKKKFKTSSEPEWNILGDTYVHGLMDGEGLATADQRLVELQDFVLV